MISLSGILKTLNAWEHANILCLIFTQYLHKKIFHVWNFSLINLKKLKKHLGLQCKTCLFQCVNSRICIWKAAGKQFWRYFPNKKLIELRQHIWIMNQTGAYVETGRRNAANGPATAPCSSAPGKLAIYAHWQRFPVPIIFRACPKLCIKCAYTPSRSEFSTLLAIMLLHGMCCMCMTKFQAFEESGI